MNNPLIEITEERGYLEIKYFGSAEEKMLADFVDSIKAEAEKRKNFKILLDLTQVTGNLTREARFKTGFYLSQHLGPEFQIGVVAEKEKINMIAKNVAASRGIKIFVSHEKSMVEKWLLSGKNT